MKESSLHNLLISRAFLLGLVSSFRAWKHTPCTPRSSIKYRGLTALVKPVIKLSGYLWINPRSECPHRESYHVCQKTNTVSLTSRKVNLVFHVYLGLAPEFAQLDLRVSALGMCRHWFIRAQVPPVPSSGWMIKVIESPLLAGLLARVYTPRNWPQNK